MSSWLFPIRCVGCQVPGQGRLCERCCPRSIASVKGNFSPIRRIFTASAYAGTLSQILVRGKGRPDRALMILLGQALARAAQPSLGTNNYTAVVPAPSPWTRRLKRGFSPASVLGIAVAARLGLPLVHGLSIAPGPRQATLEASVRIRNLRTRIRARQSCVGRVLLVDDVLTTGSTSRVCAVELLGAGAAQVDCLTLCASLAPQNRYNLHADH